MLEWLRLENIGRARSMELALAPRLNLVTGDNGPGKSFLLDVARWALTRRWPAEVNARVTSGLMARPFRLGTAAIEFAFRGKVKPARYRCESDRRAETWEGRGPGRPANPGLVLYAQVDGSFAVWDPVRNCCRDGGARPRADDDGRRASGLGRDFAPRPGAALRVRVHKQDPRAARLPFGGERHGRGRLPAAALLARDCERHHAATLHIGPAGKQGAHAPSRAARRVRGCVAACVRRRAGGYAGTAARAWPRRAGLGRARRAAGDCAGARMGIGASATSRRHPRASATRSSVATVGLLSGLSSCATAG